MKLPAFLSDLQTYMMRPSQLPCDGLSALPFNLEPAGSEVFGATQPQRLPQLSTPISPDILAREQDAMQAAAMAQAAKRRSTLQNKKADQNASLISQHRRKVYLALCRLEKEDADIKSIIRTLKSLDEADVSSLATLYPHSVQAHGVALTQRGFRRIMIGELGRKAVSRNSSWLQANNLIVDPKNNAEAEALRIAESLKQEFRLNKVMLPLSWS